MATGAATAGRDVALDRSKLHLKSDDEVSCIRLLRNDSKCLVVLFIHVAAVLKCAALEEFLFNNPINLAQKRHRLRDR